MTEGQARRRRLCMTGLGRSLRPGPAKPAPLPSADWALSVPGASLLRSYGPSVSQCLPAVLG